MPNIYNRDFSGGWKPSSDASNSPPNVLPRADNLDLEDEGVLSLRQGSDTIATSEGSDVVSLHSVELDGTARIILASPTSVYEIEDETLSGLSITLDGDNDAAIDSTSGHALIASGTAKKKYDGTTVRNWGIATPLEAPEVGGVPLEDLTIANFTQASAEFVASEGTVSYVTGQDGVANAATGLLPAVGTGRAEMTYAFPTVRNLQDFSGAQGGLFDVFEFWFVSPDPTRFRFLQIAFGLDTGSDAFQENGYIYQFGSGLEPLGLTREEVREAQAESKAAATAPEPEVPPEDPEPAEPRGPRPGRPPRNYPNIER